MTKTLNSDQLKTMSFYDIARFLGGVNPAGPMTARADIWVDHQDNTAVLDAAAEAERDGV